MPELSATENRRGLSPGILACGWICLAGGILSLVSFLKSLLIRPDFSTLTAEEFSRKYLSLLRDYLPKEELIYRLNVLRGEGLFESIDVFLNSSFYWWAQGLTGFLSIAACVLGLGLLKGREWSRVGIVWIHIFLLPVTLLSTYFCLTTAVGIFGRKYPHIRNLLSYSAHMLFLETIILVIVIIPVIMYFQSRKVKIQFQKGRKPFG